MKPQLNPSYLYFDLGSDHEVYGALSDLLASLGAKPEEALITNDGRIRYTLSIRIRLKSEVETYLQRALRLLDEKDVHPCCVELRHVVAHMPADGSLTAAEPANGIWKEVSSGYIAVKPDFAELHHTVTAPKREG